MLLFLKSLPRMYKSARKDLQRHFSMMFSSSLFIGIALLIVSLLLLLTLNIGKFTKSIEHEMEIQVSVLPTVSEEEKSNLVNQIQNLDSVSSVEFVSKEKELADLIEENGKIFKQYEGEKNPLYDVLVVKTKTAEKMEVLAKQIKKMDGVVHAEYGGSTITKLVKLFHGLRVGGYVFVGAFVVFAFFLIHNSIKMTIRLRAEEIAIMRQVGAYNWYILTPFMLEGLCIGFWGAFGPALLCGIGYPLLFKALDGHFLSEMLSLISPFPFILIVIGGVFCISLSVGMLGSYVAVKKHLRGTR